MKDTIDPEGHDARFLRLGAENGTEDVFFVYPGLDVPFCHELSESLPGRPLFLLARHEASIREPVPALDELARRHVETIRSVRPRGPYSLGSYSVGAVLAREMACQLEAAGEGVSELILVAEPRLSRWWWRVARWAAMPLTGSDQAERLDRFNLLGKLGQLGLDLLRKGGVARARRALARGRHRMKREGSLRALGPNSRSSDDTLKALLWSWAAHRARKPRGPVVRVEGEWGENGMMSLRLKTLSAHFQCSTFPAASSSARLATPSKST